jgi:hypothetical protein
VVLLLLSLLLVTMINECILVRSYTLVSGCLLCGERLMKQDNFDKFIRWLLTFTAIYFTIHVLIAIARGTI